jgi:hypothetical protein
LIFIKLVKVSITEIWQDFEILNDREVISMRNHQFFSPNTAETKDAQDPSLDKSNLRQEALTEENASIITTPEPTPYVAPIALLAIIGVVLLYKLKLLLKTPEEKHFCQNCRYFSQNHYLKCAVQPTKVFTDEAKYCCDYQPRQQKFNWPWRIHINKDNDNF